MIPVLEISTVNGNHVTTKILDGLAAETIYNLLKTQEEPVKTPEQIFTIFKDYFPHNNYVKWEHHSKNAIKITMNDPIIIDDGYYIFTYNNEKDWLLETLQHYEANLKMERSK